MANASFIKELQDLLVVAAGSEVSELAQTMSDALHGKMEECYKRQTTLFLEKFASDPQYNGITCAMLMLRKNYEKSERTNASPLILVTNTCHKCKPPVRAKAAKAKPGVPAKAPRSATCPQEIAPPTALPKTVCT